MLNKTLRANVKKIKSARSFALISVAIVLVVGLIIYKTQQGTCNGLAVRDKCVALERVDTDATRAQGLSGRDSLVKDSGMLFAYEAPAEQCFWMKDMRFNLDIIWVDSSKRIVEIRKNLAPSTYPQTFCTDNTQYVLEIMSGDANRLGLSLGQQLHF